VLDVALQTLATRGFDATTLQLIADEVGRSKAGLLHHFGSREELLMAVVRHRDDVNRELFAAGPDGDFSASVALAAHNATVPGLVALFAMGAALAGSDTTDTERRRYYTERYSRTRSRYAQRIARAQQLGVVRSDIDAESAATLILATMDGLQTQWLLDPSVDMADHLSTMISLLHPSCG